MTDEIQNVRGVSRRSMLRSAGALLGALMMPKSLGGSIASPIEETMPAATWPSSAARMYAHLRAIYSEWCMTDASYNLDPRMPGRWDQLYRELVSNHFYTHRPIDGDEDERGFFEWWAGVVPPQAMRSWSVWRKLDPLSRRYQWLDAMFEAALHQYADAWWDHELIIRKYHYGNYFDPEVKAARKRKDVALRRVRKAAYRILQYPALTLTDRHLRRRAIEVQELPPWEFAYKYRRAKILAQIRNAKGDDSDAAKPA